MKTTQDFKFEELKVGAVLVLREVEYRVTQNRPELDFLRAKIGSSAPQCYYYSRLKGAQLLLKEEKASPKKASQSRKYLD